MLPRVLAHDPGTASYHVYLLFYVAGFLTAQGSGGQFPCSCFEGTTQTAHISPPYVAVEPGWVAPWPDFGLRATSNEVNHGVKKKKFFFF